MRAVQPAESASQRFGLSGLMLAAAIGLGIGATAKAQPVTERDVARPAPLPQVLSAADAQRLRRAFAAQLRGDNAAAQREAVALDDRRLLGHLLADRHLRAPDRVTIPELQAWLTDHSDHPDAAGLHALLARHRACLRAAKRAKTAPAASPGQAAAMASGPVR